METFGQERTTFRLRFTAHASGFIIAINGQARISFRSRYAVSNAPVAQREVRVAAPSDNDALFSELCRELKRLAHSRLRATSHRAQLDTTTLVHDTYARLSQTDLKQFATPSHFMSYCSQVMRSVVVDLVRADHAERRGGGSVHVELNTEIVQSAVAIDEPTLDVLRVHDALARLKRVDPVLEKVVEMRDYAGMTEKETAEALGISERSASREWARARALLRAMLEPS